MKLLIRLFKELPVKTVLCSSTTMIHRRFHEFHPIYGDVVGWEHLESWRQRMEGKSKLSGKSRRAGSLPISTLIDLRKVEAKDWKQVVLYRWHDGGRHYNGADCQRRPCRNPRISGCEMEGKHSGFIK